MEESLREAACIGDFVAATRLIQAGVNINSANKLNGWTPLHWACRRGHLVIIELLLRHGGDVTLLTHKGERPVDVACDNEVVKLLAPDGGEMLQSHDPLPIVPHYLEHREFPYSQQREELLNSELMTHQELSYTSGHKRKTTGEDEQVNKRRSPDVLMVKCRVAGGDDDDFVEVEVAPPTFANLVLSCCQELHVNVDSVTKVRKLPNVSIRNDKEVMRFVPYQEIELVLNIIEYS